MMVTHDLLILGTGTLTGSKKLAASRELAPKLAGIPGSKHKLGRE